LPNDPKSLRDKILDTGQELFESVGYDVATVNLIIEKAGVSKGAFYHHFKAKDELLEALLNRENYANLLRIRDTGEIDGITSLARLSWFFRVVRGWKPDDPTHTKALLRVIYSDQNLFLRYRRKQKIVTALLPELDSIIKSGVRVGTFNIKVAGNISELVFRIGHELNNVIAGLIITDGEVDLNRIENEIDSYQRVIEILLGAPKDSVKLINKKAILEVAMAD